MRGKSTSKSARVPLSVRQVDMLLGLLVGRMTNMARKEEAAASVGEKAFYQKTALRFRKAAELLEQRKTKAQGPGPMAVLLSRDEFVLLHSVANQASLCYAVNPDGVFAEYPELREHGISHDELQELIAVLEPLHPDLKDMSQDAEEEEEEGAEEPVD